jgi:hypothetical protein
MSKNNKEEDHTLRNVSLIAVVVIGFFAILGIILKQLLDKALPIESPQQEDNDDKFEF